MLYILRLTLVWIAAMSANLSWAAREYVTNGDFSQGDTGFTSQYFYYSGTTLPDGRYTITANPRAAHPGAYTGPLGTHGNVMMVNGAVPKAAIWMQEVQIYAGDVHTWSAMAASNVTNAANGFNGDPAPAILDLQLANEPGPCTTAGTGFQSIATITTTSYGLNVDSNNRFTEPNWVSAQGTVTRPKDGKYCVRIYNHRTGALSGNDFMMDDLSFMGHPGITANTDIVTRGDHPSSINVTTNDTARNGGVIDPASVTVASPPSVGSVACSGAVCTFTPAPGQTEDTSFTYQVCLAAPDDATCTTATVWVLAPKAVPTLNAATLLALSGALAWLGLRRRRKMGAGAR
jgi:hypothetical protein